jgi:hypothetical protein
MTNQMPAFKFFSLIMLFMSTILFFDSCTSEECEDCINGLCVEDSSGNAFCECDPGYIGANCSSLDPCYNLECPVNTTCNDGICECDPGYSGTDCSIFDPCFTTQCPTNSTCDEGTCYCDVGFMGDSCEIEIRSQFVGFNYNGEDICPSGTYMYNVSISNSSDGADYFVIEGFAGFTTPISNITVKILDDTQFTIEEQTDAGNRVIVAGDAFGANNIGTWNAATKTLSITYKIVFDDGSAEICNMTLFQQ